MSQIERDVWEWNLLGHLELLCDPTKIKLSRGHRLADIFMLFAVILEAGEKINVFLSEYQYLNPLF